MRLVEVPAGLVGQEDPGVVHQGPRDGAALLLAPRELRGPVRHPAGESHRRQERLGPAAGPALRLPADQQGHHHVFQCRELRQQMVKLEDEPQAPVAQLVAVLLAQRIVRPAVQDDLARGRRVERAQQVQQRALARPARPDDRHGLAAMHPEVDVIQHLDERPVAASKHLADPASLEDCRHSYRIASTGCRAAARNAG